jgi:hypothetical protein
MVDGQKHFSHLSVGNFSVMFCPFLIDRHLQNGQNPLHFVTRSINPLENLRALAVSSLTKLKVLSAPYGTPGERDRTLAGRSSPLALPRVP